jgi:hypothetical protein
MEQTTTAPEVVAPTPLTKDELTPEEKALFETQVKSHPPQPDTISLVFCKTDVFGGSFGASGRDRRIHWRMPSPCFGTCYSGMVWHQRE